MKTRVLSALVAIALVTSFFILFQALGLYVLAALVTAGAIFEYMRLTLGRVLAPFGLRAIFCALSGVIFLVTVARPDLALAITAICALGFLTACLLMLRSTTGSRYDDPQEILPAALQNAMEILSFGAVGFFYCGLFPGLTVSLLRLEQGPLWFLGLLAIVFSGDTFAYFTGRVAGQRKLLPAVSPQKTIEGSAGGLLGSGVAAFFIGYFLLEPSGLPSFSLGAYIAIAALSGVSGQLGDLFESLLKRIAHVKDSGAIMPGHGGFLDRIDGVLFAGPLYAGLVFLFLAAR